MLPCSQCAPSSLKNPSTKVENLHRFGGAVALAHGECSLLMGAALYQPGWYGVDRSGLKRHLALHNEDKACEDAAALSDEAINWDSQAAMLKDAIRFVPELAPLAAAAALNGAPWEPSLGGVMRLFSGLEVPKTGGFVLIGAGPAPPIKPLS
jgi:hypothetical protein